MNKNSYNNRDLYNILFQKLNKKVHNKLQLNLDDILDEDLNITLTVNLFEDLRQETNIIGEPPDELKIILFYN